MSRLVVHALVAILASNDADAILFADPPPDLDSAERREALRLYDMADRAERCAGPRAFRRARAFLCGETERIGGH